MNADKTMDSNALIQLLRTLSEEEWKSFEKFVSSPYFNKGRNYIPLLKILKKFYPDFSSPELTKEYLYKKLYPGQEYKDSVLSTMFSRLYNISIEFLTHIAIEKNTYMHKEICTLQELRNRGLNTKYLKLAEEVEKSLAEKKMNVNDFEIFKWFNREISYFYAKNDKREKMISPLKNSLKYSMYNFLIAFFYEDVSLYYQRSFWKSDEMESFERKLFENMDTEKILNLIRENDINNFKYLYFFYLNKLAMKDPLRDDLYLKVKEQAFELLPSADTNMKKIIFNSVMNQCNRRFLLGDGKYKMEAFEIRKKAIEETYDQSPPNIHLQRSEFRSMFIDALNVKEIEWAKEFSEKYVHKLLPEFRKDIELYCKARIAYERKDFNKAVEYAVQVNINQITFKLDIKNLLSKIYYDTKTTEPLISLLNTYYQLIVNSDSQNSEFLKRHSNFIKYFRKFLSLTELNLKVDKFELNLLKENIEKDNVSAKTWLMNKIGEKLS